MKGLLFGLLCTPILLSAQINESDTLRLLAEWKRRDLYFQGKIGLERQALEKMGLQDPEFLHLPGVRKAKGR